MVGPTLLTQEYFTLPTLNKCGWCIYFVLTFLVNFCIKWLLILNANDCYMFYLFNSQKLYQVLFETNLNGFCIICIVFFIWRGAWNKTLLSDFWWIATFSFQFALCMLVNQRENFIFDQESLRAIFHAPLHFRKLGATYF